MKTFMAILAAVAALAVAAPAGAMPIDNYRAIPTDAPRATPPAPVPPPSSGTDTWVVLAAVVLAFGAGAGAARLVTVRPRVRA